MHNLGPVLHSEGLKQVGVTPMYAFGAFELILTLRSLQALLV